MKSWILIAILCLGIGFGAGVLQAEETAGEGGAGQEQGGAWQGPGAGGGPGKMKPGMGMMKDSIVATSDGGVVVMQGPRLIKYDKDLTLVREVELPRGKKPPQEASQPDANADAA